MNETYMETYDIVVIGAGPGGYVAAIRAAQLGKSVAIVEKDKVGGACLNVGCIPSKTYLKHSEIVEDIQQANEWGIQSREVKIDFSKLKKRKDQVVQTLISGVNSLLKKNGVTIYSGMAEVEENLVVTIGENKIKGKDILLATGSKPFVPPIPGLDKAEYLTTDTFFNLQKLPKSLVIIGAGVIGVELAFAMAPLGTKVTLIEVASDILLTEDKDAVQVIKKQLQKQNIQTFVGTEIKEIKKDQIILPETEIPFDQLLVATGRNPNSEIATQLQLKVNKSGKYVVVNENYETSKKHVYAVGDLIGGYQLAHAASAEGIKAVQAIAGKAEKKIALDEIPRCVYVRPEIASFGMNEIEAREAGYDVTVTKSSVTGNGKAIAMGETEGFVKIISETMYQEILGAVVVAPNATELIGGILAVKQSEGTVYELASVIQPHPSISEAIGESADALFQQAIHM